MIKIAIADDEKDICNLLEKLLFRYSVQVNTDYEVDKFNTCEDLFSTIRMRKSYDIVFLDIEFQKMSGIELGKLIRNELMDEETAIIYVSAVEGYSMQLFKLHPFDFLIKPMTFEKVKECMDTYFKTYYLRDKYFRFVKDKAENEVAVSQIKYFKSVRKKMIIYTNHGEIECYGQLSECIEQEGIKNFILIHQSYLINPIYIDRFGFDHVVIKNDIKLPISRLRQKEVREQLLNL